MIKFGNLEIGWPWDDGRRFVPFAMCISWWENLNLSVTLLGIVISVKFNIKT